MSLTADGVSEVVSFTATSGNNSCQSDTVDIGFRMFDIIKCNDIELTTMNLLTGLKVNNICRQTWMGLVYICSRVCILRK